jgi:hypothetical protein
MTCKNYSHRLLGMKGILNIVESEKLIVMHDVEHYLFPEARMTSRPEGLLTIQLIIIGDGFSEAEVRAKL